jgi:hypothetical protein
MAKPPTTTQKPMANPKKCDACQGKKQAGKNNH